MSLRSRQFIGNFGSTSQSCKIRGAEVPDFAKLAGGDHLLGERHRRAAAIIVTQHVHDASLANRVEHLAGLLKIVGQRLLAEDVLAGLGRGDCHVAVKVAGADTSTRSMSVRATSFFQSVS